MSAGDFKRKWCHSKVLLPAGLLCRRRLIFDVRPSVRPCVRASVRPDFFRVLPTTTRTRDTRFECLYTVSNLKLSKIDQKKLSFCNKGTIDEKVFLKKVGKKITELDMPNLWFFHKLDSFARCKIKKNLMFLAVWKLDHVTSTHLKIKRRPHKSPAGHPCPAPSAGVI